MWWWESFKAPSEYIHFVDGFGFEEVPNLVPNPNEVVWFVVEDTQSHCYPIFEATVSDAVKVIGECFAYEYYLIPKNKDWLICETHHNSVVGVGNEITSRIKARNM